MKKEIKVIVSGDTNSGKTSLIRILYEFLKSKNVETFVNSCEDYSTIYETLGITRFIEKNRHSNKTSEELLYQLIDETVLISENVVKETIVSFQEVHDNYNGKCWSFAEKFPPIDTDGSNGYWYWMIDRNNSDSEWFWGYLRHENLSNEETFSSKEFDWKVADESIVYTVSEYGLIKKEATHWIERQIKPN